MSPLIAFHLPQFHPIPENDEWWGKGFTEWTNVTLAKPLLPGHEQPHLPADLGFYDLRLPQVRQQQAALAKQYHISAFCYYHYWFNGRRMLNAPTDEIFQSGEPDFPYCLCWANEPWGRNWDGSEKQILVSQHYSHDDDVKHILFLIERFKDKRYLRFDGKPVFLVYRAAHRPDIAAMLSTWRQVAKAEGIGELMLLRVDSHGQWTIDPRPLGFDAAVDFTPGWYPHLRHRPLRRLRGHALQLKRISWRLWKKADDQLAKFEERKNNVYVRNNVYDYQETVQFLLNCPKPEWPRYECAFPRWDNTARRRKGGASIFMNSTPKLYEHYLKTLIERSQGQPVFINAWNEWAEGCHLEPCRTWGHAYLEATKRAVGQ